MTDFRTGRRAAITLAVAALAATAAGLTAAAPAAVAAEQAPPTVTLTSPRTGWSYDAPATVDLRATASSPSGAVARVEFYDGAALVGTDTSAPYSLRLIVTADGIHTLTARAYDEAGLSATSAAAAIQVLTPPTIVVRGLVQAGVEAGCLVLSSGGVVYNLYRGDPAVVRVGALLEIYGQLPRFQGSTCQQGRILWIIDAKPLPGLPWPGSSGAA